MNLSQEVLRLLEKSNKPDPSQIVEVPKRLRRKSRVTLKQIYLNFPYSVYKYDPIPPQPVKIRRIELTEDELVMTVHAYVKSVSRPGKYHSCVLQLARPNTNIDWSWDLPVAVRCSCESFRYFLAYALYSHGALFGRPSLWNKVPAKIRNPMNIPQIGKHLCLLTEYLIKHRIIKGKIVWNVMKYKDGGRKK